jgi:hypothetical protein
MRHHGQRISRQFDRVPAWHTVKSYYRLIEWNLPVTGSIAKGIATTQALPVIQYATVNHFTQRYSGCTTGNPTDQATNHCTSHTA